MLVDMVMDPMAEVHIIIAMEVIMVGMVIITITGIGDMVVGIPVGILVGHGLTGGRHGHHHRCSMYNVPIITEVVLAIAIPCVIAIV